MENKLFEQVHFYRKKDNLAKRKNSVVIDENWGIAVPDFADEALLNGINDFFDYFKSSFDLNISAADAIASNKIIFSLDNSLKDVYKIVVSENNIEITAANSFNLVQALFFIEDRMNIASMPALELKTFCVSPKYKKRITQSALSGKKYTKEYLNKILHYGYNGVIVYSEDDVELPKKMGFSVYLSVESISVDFSRTASDAVIIENLPSKNELEAVGEINVPVIFSILNYDQNYEELFDAVKNFPAKTTFLVSFDANQAIAKDGVEFLTGNGSIVMSQGSDCFGKFVKLAKENKYEILVSTCAGGRTNEFGTVPYIPGMMQWLLRNEALKEFDVLGTVEADKYGFIPSIVGEFAKAQLLSSAQDGGICMQELAAMYYGAENTEKIMMVFKKISDGANYLFFNSCDYCGPLLFGPAYPLVKKDIYDFPFNKKDITLETDCNLKAADCFNRAAAILSSVSNENARELMNICRFIVNTLVTSANVKRWYRRLYTIKNMDLDFKKKFLLEQMVKIGEQEIQNTLETAEIIEEMPILAYNCYENLCTLNSLDAKIKLTQAAISEIKNEMEKFA